MVPLFNLKSFCEQDDVFHIARTTISSENDLRQHQHDFVEIFWIKEGNGTHQINGQEVPLIPGSLWIVRPSDCHTFRMSSKQKGLVVTNIAFSYRDIQYYLNRYLLKPKFYFDESKEMPFSCILSQKQLHELSNHTDRLLIGKRTYLQLDHLVLHLFSMIEVQHSSESSIPHWLSLTLQQFTTPEQLCSGIPSFVSLTGKTTDYVNRILKSCFKQTLTETVNNKRLEFATHQLIYTNTAIKIITSECGFSSVSYFHRLFKEKYGVTPKEFRDRNHKIF